MILIPQLAAGLFNHFDWAGEW